MAMPPLVAGMQLTPGQWAETQDLCAALRDSHAVVVSWSFEPCAAVAAAALSGATKVLVYASEACRAELRALKTSLAVFDSNDSDAALCTPLFGPVVVLQDTVAAFTRPREGVCDLVLVMMTMRDAKAHQNARTRAKKMFPSGVPIIVHAPLCASSDEEAAMLATVASYVQVGGLRPSHPPPHGELYSSTMAMTNGQWGLGGEVPRFEVRPHAPFSDAMRRSICTGDALLSASRLRASARRDAEVVAFVKTEALPDRDVVVVCDTRTVMDTMKRLLSRAKVHCVQTVLLESLLARTGNCMAPARGARPPVLVFADPPAYEAELRAARAHACRQLGDRPVECVVFVWAPTRDGALATTLAPAAWEETPNAVSAEALVRAFFS
jgi:hypothetical protein